MIIFLYGPDTYRSREKLQEIIEHYKKIHKSGLNLKYFEGNNLNFEEFQDEFQQSSMFKENKLLILKNSWSCQNFKEKFLENYKKFNNSKNIILFYEEDEISQAESFFKFLKKNGQTQEFEFLKDQKLKNWIKKEVGKYQCQIEEKALEKLVEFIGNDLWRQSNEIKKLVSYLQKNKTTPILKVKDVELLVKPKIETDIFKTIDAIALKNKRKALELLKKHLEKGDSPLYLLSMINFQFRNLLIVKDLIEKHEPYYFILKKAQLNPFVVKKSYQQANEFTLSELKKIYRKIFQIDLDIKTGRINPQMALDLLIAEV